jgi:hypothetical protein
MEGAVIQGASGVLELTSKDFSLEESHIKCHNGCGKGGWRYLMTKEKR